MAFDWALIVQFAQDWAKPIAQIIGGPAAGTAVGWLVGRRRRASLEFAVQTNAVTKRFNALMDGYEARINDLVAEVERLKQTIKELQAELARRVPSIFGQ